MVHRKLQRRLRNDKYFTRFAYLNDKKLKSRPYLQQVKAGFFILDKLKLVLNVICIFVGLKTGLKFKRHK